MKWLKRFGVAVCALIVGAALGSLVGATTAAYNQTVRIVDSAGNVINGTASATSAAYNQTVQVVDSTGHVIDSFGSSGITSGTTTITSGADKSVCFDDGGVINCADNGFQYTKATGSAQISSFGAGVAADGTAGDITFKSAGGDQLTINNNTYNQFGFKDVTNSTHFGLVGDAFGNMIVKDGAGLGIGNDSIHHTMARMPMFFDEGKEAALVANESMGTFKTVTAITIENIELDVKISPTCSVSEQITCYDCGNAAGACTSGQTSTVMSAVTIASGATRQSADETVNTANVAAGEYISCQITAGTCTVSDNAITMMARPQ